MFHAHVEVQVKNLTKTFPAVTILNTAFTLSVVESDLVLRVAGDSTFQSYDVIANGPLGMFQSGNVAFSGYFTGYVKFGLNAVVAQQLALNLFMPVRVTVPNMMESSDITLSVGLDFDISGLRTQVLVWFALASLRHHVGLGGSYSAHSLNTRSRQAAVTQLSSIEIDFGPVLPAAIKDRLNSTLGITVADINKLVGGIQKVANFTQMAEDAWDSLRYALAL